VTRPGRSLLQAAGRRGILPGAVWKRLPVSAPFTVPVGGRGSFRYVPAHARDLFARPLCWRGLDAREPESVAVFLRLVGASRLFVDVGAHTGLYTLTALAADAAVRVVAFEPESRVRAALVENVKANGWEQRCEVRSEAVADRGGRATFHVPHHPLPTSARLAGTPARPGAVDDISVPVVALDEALAGEERVDIVKIDVEGAQDGVVRGMRRVLSHHRPVLFIECLPADPLVEIEDLLRSAGYRFFHLRRSGPSASSGLVADPRHVERNYLCVHESDVDAIARATGG
jgi:FkbM family methyltransferase